MLLLALVLACRSVPTPPDPSLEPVVSEVVLPEELVTLEALSGGMAADEAGCVVVAVHGLGSDAKRFSRSAVGLGVRARIISPDGPYPYSRGYSWFDVDVRRGDTAALGAAVLHTAHRVAELLRRLPANRPSSGKPVITGFSQGGMVSLAVAAHHPDTIAAAVPVAGWLPESAWPEGPAPAGAPPVRALHGSVDTVLPLGPTAAGIEHLRAAGWDAEIQVFEDVAHQIPPPVRQAWREAIQEACAATRSSPAP